MLTRWLPFTVFGQIRSFKRLLLSGCLGQAGKTFIGDLISVGSQPALCNKARHCPTHLYSLCMETVMDSWMVRSFSCSQRSDLLSWIRVLSGVRLWFSVLLSLFSVCRIGSLKAYLYLPNIQGDEMLCIQAKSGLPVAAYCHILF